MKSSLMVLALTALMGTQAFAAGAMEYQCIGVNRAGDKNSTVEFSVDYTDYDREGGFTNQLITIDKVDGKEVSSPISLQMFQATAADHCKVNNFGEIQMNPKVSNFSMNASGDKNQDGEVTTFKVSCGTVNLDVVGVCTL